MRAPDHALELERFLPYRLSVLTNIISSRIARTYSEQFGLTIPEWRVIAVLARYPGLSAKGTADRTGMDKVMVSRAVSRLEKHQRLTRRPGAHDRRESQLHLTARGRAIYARIAPLARAIEARLLATLEPEEEGALDRALDKLQRAALEI
ncbi:MAG TPA: MarR family transcriptional regulator [Alphaproteobacteria bacterium]|nr:MarR family transcriptional regulator [Alphaproteobacteria bacterium]